MKMNKNDAFCLGLLYVYIHSYTKQKMVMLKDLIDFHEAIEKNLEEMGSEVVAKNNIQFYEESIFFSSYDKDGIEYYVLKSDFDVEKAKTSYISSLPIDYFIAAQKNNALSCLGLVKIDDKILVKSELIKEKTENYHCINCEFFIDEEAKKQIISENVILQSMPEEEAYKKICYCDIYDTIDTPLFLDKWCPKFKIKTNEQTKDLARVRK